MEMSVSVAPTAVSWSRWVEALVSVRCEQFAPLRCRRPGRRRLRQIMRLRERVAARGQTLARPMDRAASVRLESTYA